MDVIKYLSNIFENIIVINCIQTNSFHQKKHLPIICSIRKMPYNDQMPK